MKRDNDIQLGQNLRIGKIKLKLSNEENEMQVFFL